MQKINKKPLVSFLILMIGLPMNAVLPYARHCAVKGVNEASSAGFLLLGHPPFLATIWLLSILLLLLLIILIIITYRYRRCFKQYQKKYQELEDVSKEQKMDGFHAGFLPNLKNEIRPSLLFVISTISSMIKEETDTDKKEKIRLILHNVNQLLLLANQFVDWQEMSGKGVEKEISQEALNPFAPTSSKETEQSVSKYEKPLVLLVDGDDEKRSSLRQKLLAHYNVSEAANGVEGLQKVVQEHPNLILSDVVMPQMDGYEFCRKVKENPDTADIPFLILTDQITQKQQIEGFKSGANDYLAKPFKLEILCLRMENLLNMQPKPSAQIANKSLSDSCDDGILSEEPQLSALDEKLLKEITDYIETNVSDENLNVETLSSAMRMSRVQLYRRVLALTGNTPSEIIRNIRLKRAEQMLHDKDYTVSEIAYMVGFGNPRYLSKYFVEVYGMTPSVYRKKFKT
jgi:CheY-like chemotaxis protein